MNQTNEFSFILKPAKNPEHGVGVFTLHNIDEGILIAAFLPTHSSRHMKKEDIPESLLGYCVGKEDGTYACPNDFSCMEIGWYLNHSKNPNIAGNAIDGFYSLRSINAGEELLLNYNDLGEPEEMKEDYYKNK
jgi:SET domain-containing protein